MWPRRVPGPDVEAVRTGALRVAADGLVPVQITALHPDRRRVGATLAILRKIAKNHRSVTGPGVEQLGGCTDSQGPEGNHHGDTETQRHREEEENRGAGEQGSSVTEFAGIPRLRLSPAFRRFEFFEPFELNAFLCASGSLW